MRTMILLGPVLALLAACDSECDDPKRIDGQWAVFANATSSDWQVTGFTEEERAAGDQAALLDNIFPNGWSTWDIRYTPGRDRYAIEIDGQNFEADHTPDATSCNRIQLTMAGLYQAPEGSTHEFDMDAEVVWTGDELVGSFAYADAWTTDEKDGVVRIPAGELRATLGAAPDTGG
jgi:hypothetical protein